MISKWMRMAVAAGTLAAASMMAFAGQPAIGTIRTTVPFSFEMDGKTMPAGQYVFRPSNDFQNVMKVESPDGSVTNVATSPASSATAGTEPRLVFDRGESGYVLKEVWMKGVPSGKSIPVKSAQAGKSAAPSVD